MISQHNVHLKNGAQDAAVLVDLVGALPQRVGRHRRDRHGVADVAGDLCRRVIGLPGVKFNALK